jgi:predicted NAD/FAD-dependent oxidoreductase
MEGRSGNQRVAVIGAGLAGIAAAREFVRKGMTVTVFEKSRGMGGRCASKRWEGHVIDHGAQYFTIRDERFRAAVLGASGDRVQELAAPVRSRTGGPASLVAEPARWFHREGNSRLVRDLAGDLDVRLETTVAEAGTLLRAGGGEFDHVLSTAPWPQTARLFGIEPAGLDLVPCLAVALAYRGQWLGGTSAAYAFRETDGPMAWTACENHKPGRIAPGFTVLLAHLSEPFSRAHLEEPAEAYPDLVRPMVEEAWQLPDGAFVAGFGHRWRYARVEQPLRLPDLPPGLHFAGDAVRASRVEDAWLAGHEFASNFS